MSNRHLNVFEYYSQKNILPIENNSTRNLGIVLKSNLVCFDRFLDLILSKCSEKNNNIRIEKPRNETEFFLDIQVGVAALAQRELIIENIIGATLTTQEAKFYSDELEFSENRNITDMVIYSAGTLIIIEAKRNAQDATNQLEGQLKEFVLERNKGNDNTLNDYVLISLVWEEVINCLYEVNLLTNKTNLILDDYIAHIKNSVPTFFPVHSFSNLSSYDNEHIERRIERFAINTNLEYLIRNSASGTVYWIMLSKNPYLISYAFQNYDNDLMLSFFPGNTGGQGYHLYNKKNKLSILNKEEITIAGDTFKIECMPNIKISDAWGKWKFDIPLNTSNSKLLRELYSEICGRKYSQNNPTFIEQLKKHSDILSVNYFTKEFNNTFKDQNHNYTFLVSITVGIFVKGLYPFFKQIDKIDSPQPENDILVDFSNKAFDEVCYWIEN